MSAPPPRYGLLVEDMAHVGVYLVDKNTQLLKVLELMDKKQISAVIIEDLDDLLHYYIISHTDIVRFLVKNRSHLDYLGLLVGGKTLMQETKAKDIMRGPIEIIQKDTPIDELIGILLKTGFKRAIVGNEKNQPIGIITTKDIIKWNSVLLPPGIPFVLSVMEMESGLVLCKHFFEQDITDGFLSILGGSISAVSGITSEILKHSGNVRLIEKDNYEIMLETAGQIAAFLVVDRSSITLRRKLQNFLRQFREKYAKELQRRKDSRGLTPVNVFNIQKMAEMFK
ncbi:HPP family protein [Candidatus Lokiarchaeum ossiferum]